MQENLLLQQLDELSVGLPLAVPLFEQGGVLVLQKPLKFLLDGSVASALRIFQLLMRALTLGIEELAHFLSKSLQRQHHVVFL